MAPSLWEQAAPVPLAPLGGAPQLDDAPESQVEMHPPADPSATSLVDVVAFPAPGAVSQPQRERSVVRPEQVVQARLFGGPDDA